MKKIDYRNKGLYFIGPMFIGLGIGMFFNHVAVGVLIGMGVGFILMGFLD